jgi:hypothetical protein
MGIHFISYPSISFNIAPPASFQYL